MLVILRKASRTLFAKILLLLLVVSFGVWGISASLFSNTSDTVIAVGDQSVSSSDFAFAYQRQVADMSNRFGMQLTTEQARAFGIEAQVFSQLSAGAALDQLASDMNLGLSQDRLAQLIADDPAFKGRRRELVAEDFVYALKRHASVLSVEEDAKRYPLAAGQATRLAVCAGRAAGTGGEQGQGGGAGQQRQRHRHAQGEVGPEIPRQVRHRQPARGGSAGRHRGAARPAVPPPLPRHPPRGRPRW